MSDIITIIKDIGFPIFVSLFLLIRIEPTLKKLEITIAQTLQFLQDNRRHGKN